MRTIYKVTILGSFARIFWTRDAALAFIHTRYTTQRTPLDHMKLAEQPINKR